MGVPQTIRTEAGDELVVLTRRDYDILLARGGDPEAEDRLTVQIVAEIRAEAAVSNIKPLPAEVWEALEAPNPPSLGERLFLLRKARAMTQQELAAVSGVEQSLISAIEAGTEAGSQSTYLRLAVALAVDGETLTDEPLD